MSGPITSCKLNICEEILVLYHSRTILTSSDSKRNEDDDTWLSSPIFYSCSKPCDDKTSTAVWWLFTLIFCISYRWLKMALLNKDELPFLNKMVIKLNNILTPSFSDVFVFLTYVCFHLQRAISMTTHLAICFGLGSGKWRSMKQLTNYTTISVSRMVKL